MSEDQKNHPDGAESWVAPSHARQRLATAITDAMPYFYGSGDAANVSKSVDQMRRLEATLPTELRDDPQLLLDSVGIPRPYWELDDERTDAFRKEGELQVSTEAFQVLQDNQGEPWLVKSARKKSWEEPGYAYAPTLDRLQTIRDHQAEVLAWRIANAIGYPMNETRLIQKAGRPWLAYRYVDDARDVDTFSLDELAPEVTNPGQVYNRTLFNALVNAGGDSASQAVIDSDGNYNASDIRMGVGRLADPSKNINDSLRDSLAAFAHGKLYIDNPVAIRAYHEFMNNLAQLDNDQIVAAFSDFLGDEGEKGLLAHRIAERRNALVELWNSGFFAASVS